MRHILLIAAIVLAAVVAVTANSQMAAPDPQIWGTYVWQTQTSFGPLPALVTLHIDGTASVSDAEMFGGLNLARRRTPMYGVWERTGGKSFAGTSLYLVFDAATGAVTRYGRVRVSAEFADFNHFQGRMFAESLACATAFTCPDPLDPAANWVPSPNMPPDGFQITGARLERIPPGPLQP